jgi:hypothetical protein
MCKQIIALANRKIIGSLFGLRINCARNRTAICTQIRTRVWGWLHERFGVRFHVRFTVNRRCNLVYLRFGVAHGIATVYT